MVQSSENTVVNVYLHHPLQHTVVYDRVDAVIARDRNEERMTKELNITRSERSMFGPAADIKFILYIIELFQTYFQHNSEVY